MEPEEKGKKLSDKKEELGSNVNVDLGNDIDKKNTKADLFRGWGGSTSELDRNNKKPTVDVDVKGSISKKLGQKSIFSGWDSSASESDPENVKPTNKVLRRRTKQTSATEYEQHDSDSDSVIITQKDNLENLLNDDLTEDDEETDAGNNYQDLPVFTQNRRQLIKSPYESLDYDICESSLWHQEQVKTTKRFELMKDITRWVVFLQIGIVTALIASTIDIIIDKLSYYKYGFLSKSVDQNMLSGNLALPYFYWLLTSVVPVGLGAALVTYIEPVAAGSGIPQVKCYLNGVKVPRIVRVKTLFVKATGVITSVVGGLAGGKEGPMIHSGAVVAAGISQGKSTSISKDFRILKYFRDDHEKRDFVLGGAAAGVASAFGAPIGGMLFSLEEAASFWNQNLIWRTLFASTISSFTLNVVLSAYHDLKNFTIPGLFNLGKFGSLPYQYFELPIFILMGVMGGLVGALWNHCNTKLNLFRRNYIRKKWAKVLEAIVISIVGVTLACIMTYTINDCRPLGDDPTNFPVQLYCKDGQYNAVASLWFQTPEESVRSLLHDPPGSHNILTLTLFVLTYYILVCLAFGLNVSLGIFIPTILVGAGWGRLFALVLGLIFPSASFLHPGKYALIGAAAHLGGVLRMTISLTVILLETTGVDTSFSFPLIITIISAKWMGDYFNEGIYDTQIKVNHVPMLSWEPPSTYKGLTAKHIMNSPVKCLKVKEKASYIVNLLKNTEHNGFPVVEDVVGDNRSNGRLCGMILRSQLVVIIKRSFYEELKRMWKEDVTIETFRMEYPRYPTIRDIHLHTDKADYTVNLKRFMNPSPVRISEYDSVPRIFTTFRALGLRHMIVIDKTNRVVGIVTRKDFLYKYE